MKKNNHTKVSELEFTNVQGELLLKIARRAIAEKLGCKEEKFIIPDQEIFHSGRGNFVTLKIKNNLRGCIGTFASDNSVPEGIAENAVKAAFKDYRFQPLTKEELEEIDIEVSILTEAMPFQYKNADELIAGLRPGIDGVIIRKGSVGSTFLPQVWAQLPEPVDFLEHLCQKAGLSKNAWRSTDLKVLTYQVQYFEE